MTKEQLHKARMIDADIRDIESCEGFNDVVDLIKGLRSVGGAVLLKAPTPYDRYFKVVVRTIKKKMAARKSALQKELKSL